MKTLLTVLALGVCLFASPARAALALDIAALAGVAMDNQSVSGAPITASAKSWISYGVLANFLPSDLSLSAGLFRTEMGSHQNFTNSGVTLDYDEKVPYWQAVAIADYWLVKYVGVGFGAYYGIAAGDISDTGTASSAGVSIPYSNTYSFSSGNYASSDYGLVGHAQVKIPLGVLLFLTANVMYEYGLQNVATSSGITAHNSALIAQGGVGLSF